MRNEQKALEILQSLKSDVIHKDQVIELINLAALPNVYETSNKRPKENEIVKTDSEIAYCIDDYFWFSIHGKKMETPKKWCRIPKI